MISQHPGTVLREHYLQPQGISQNKLARAIKVPPRRINEIIHGKRGITADTAVRLAIYFGNSASYWTHLQSTYEIEKIKHNITTQLAGIQTSQGNIRQTLKSGVIPKLNSTKQNPGKNNSLKKRIMR